MIYDCRARKYRVIINSYRLVDFTICTGTEDYRRVIPCGFFFKKVPHPLHFPRRFSILFECLRVIWNTPYDQYTGYMHFNSLSCNLEFFIWSIYLINDSTWRIAFRWGSIGIVLAHFLVMLMALDRSINRISVDIYQFFSRLHL